MRFELKRIEMWPLFRITFFVSASLFTLFFLLLGNSLMEMSQMISGNAGGMEGMGNMGVASLILAAVMNAFFFSAFIAAGAALYNVFSRQFGGYLFDFDGDFEVELLEEEIPLKENVQIESPTALSVEENEDERLG